MAVHLIRVFASTAGMSLSEINAAMDDWMSKQSEWLDDPTEHVIVETNSATEGTGVEHYRGDYRLTFDSEPKDNILQKCGDKLKNKVDWWQLGYHVCDHDEATRNGCSWDDIRTGGTVPAEVAL